MLHICNTDAFMLHNEVNLSIKVNFFYTFHYSQYDCTVVQVLCFMCLIFLRERSMFKSSSWCLPWEREKEMLRLELLSCLWVLSGGIVSSISSPHHEPTDYCGLLGEDDISGLKHGFLAGNNVILPVSWYDTNDKVDNLSN